MTRILTFPVHPRDHLEEALRLDRPQDGDPFDIENDALDRMIEATRTEPQPEDRWLDVCHAKDDKPFAVLLAEADALLAEIDAAIQRRLDGADDGGKS